MLAHSAEELMEVARKFHSYLPDPQTYANLRPFYQTWAQIDPDAAFAGARAIPDLLCREIATEQVAQSARPEGAGRIAQLMLEQPEGTYRTELKDRLVDTAIGNWSQSNPAAAAQFLESRPELLARNVGNLVGNWGWIDPPAALAWFDQHADVGPERFSVFQELMTGWVQKAPVGAADYILDHIDEPRASVALGTVAFGLFYVDNNVAKDWVVKLPAGELRSGAAGEIASAWASDDPSAAAVWAATQPPEDAMQALTATAAAWARKDAHAMLQWTNTLPLDSRNQILRHAIISSSLSMTPESKLTVAGTISDSDLQREALTYVLNEWRESDPASAETWIRSRSPAERAALSASLSEQNLGP
ncbi:hypothetical protein BH18VER1_BH18VER1_15010 [soil metagenome]